MSGSKGAFRLPGATWDRFRCTVEPSPGHIQCQTLLEEGEKTPTPETRVSIWTLLRTPGRFTTRPLPVYLNTTISVVRPFSVLSKDEIGL